MRKARRRRAHQVVRVNIVDSVNNRAPAEPPPLVGHVATGDVLAVKAGAAANGNDGVCPVGAGSDMAGESAKTMGVIGAAGAAPVPESLAIEPPATSDGIVVAALNPVFDPCRSVCDTGSGSGSRCTGRISAGCRDRSEQTACGLPKL